MPFFKIDKIDKSTDARTGTVSTAHGQIDTPVFMPVGTKAAVKAIKPEDLYILGSRIILGNLYHLYLQPGIEIIEKAGSQAFNEARPISDVRSSANYRKKMVAVLTRRALKEAHEQALTS